MRVLCVLATCHAAAAFVSSPRPMRSIAHKGSALAAARVDRRVEIEGVKAQLDSVALSIAAVDARIEGMRKYKPTPFSELRQEYEQLRADKRRLTSDKEAVATVYNQLRFEVDTYPSAWNGPILGFAVTTTAFLLFQHDFVAVQSLYENDAYMTASWLPESEKLLMRLPLDLLDSYGAAIAQFPILIKALTSCVSYLLGDMLAQIVEGRNKVEQLDLARSGRNALIGLLLHGPLLHYWIGIEEGSVTDFFGGPESKLAIFVKIFLDQTAFALLINVLYSSVDSLLDDQSGAGVWEKAKTSWEKTKDVVPRSMVQSWRFWPIVHLVSYSPFIPVDFKILWIDAMEIVWVTILSSVVNGEPDTVAAIIPDIIPDWTEEEPAADVLATEEGLGLSPMITAEMITQGEDAILEDAPADPTTVL